MSRFAAVAGAAGKGLEDGIKTIMLLFLALPCVFGAGVFVGWLIWGGPS